MGGFKRSVIETVRDAVSFVIGAPTDDEQGFHIKELTEPMYGIPPWRPGKQVRYVHMWKDLLVGIGEADVQTIFIIFRSHKHSYDKPRFYHVDKYGIRRLVPKHMKKNLHMEKKKRGSDIVLEEKTIKNDTWAIKWEFLKDNFIYFDCAWCGKRIEDCTFNGDHPLEEIDRKPCPTCGGECILYDTPIDGEEWLRVWSCKKCFWREEVERFQKKSEPEQQG